MAELNFRIVLVPKENVDPRKKSRLLALAKSELERCKLTVVSLSFSEVKKSENENYPELEELVLEVQAKSEMPHQGPKALLYEEFCFRWKDASRFLPCSYIELFGSDFFVYPRRTHQRISYDCVSFGVLPHNGDFYRFAKLSSKGIVDFYHDTRNVLIDYKEFQMTFSYDNIRNVFMNIQNNKPKELYLDLFNPPIITRVDDCNFLTPFSYPQKYRNLNLRPAGLQDLLELISTKHRSERQPEIDTDVLGRSNVLCLTSHDSEDLRTIISNIHLKCSKKSVYFSSIRTVEKTKPCDPVIEHMHFGCTYLLTAIFKRNFVVVSQTTDVRTDLRQLHRFSEQNPDSLERALTSVLLALDSGKIVDFWRAIEKQYEHYVINGDEINFRDYIVPAKCCTIRRLTLTPTRHLLWPPEVMYGNRILRQFDSEYALRVSFRDDNMSRLSYTAWRSDPGVYESCIEDPMRVGVRVGPRRYEFLAWSNSQIRDHGVWMYAEDARGNTSAHIRQWMGDFSHIRNVPKYMARMGQCFSQTEDALSVPLDPRHVRTENDVEGGWDRANGKPYCFSDGVGRISKELAARVHQALGHDKICSAFQIRYGGYKGMLVIDPTLRDTQIVFRKSMKKFDCSSDRLEIAKTSGPVPLQLNRPFITLLNDLGVRHRVFTRLQEDVLQTLTAILYDEHEAVKFLQSKTPFDSYCYEELSSSGIHLTTNPFFKAILLALHRHHIEKLKMRANIMVDPDKGRNMLGVMDEYGVLSYGQVFVQYTKDISYGETTKDTVILKGRVLVTKNPCMHPGDVRKFEAVDVPALHHIVDCIVFPQKGPRPHPSEMAGSDLDGDEYAVLWSPPELIFYGQNKDAADFPAVHSPDVPRITVAHMIQFLQDYIKNDQVGSIANAHLAHADAQGIFSGACLAIANKFSIAVDFAKNGKSQQLSKEERPKKYPDFMEKYTGENYKSTKALGKMYRVCKDFESENQATSINYENVKVDSDLMFPGWERYKDNAIKSKNKYNALLRSVLRNYGIEHEAEAFSGAFTNLHCRFHERKDRNEIEKVIIGCIKRLNKCMLEEFMEEFLYAGDVKGTQIRMLQKASAWYVMTYSDPDGKFLSFPWTVSKCLTNIKLQRTLAELSPFPPAIIDLDSKIAECMSKNLLPQYVETRIWNDYDVICSTRIIQEALRTLMLWAEDVEIIEKPGRNSTGYVNVFVKLFLHVAEKSGYVTKKYAVVKKPQKHYSSGHLCMEFFRFCSTFRFYNPQEINDLLTFPLYKHTKLAKRAIVTYHKFALSGKLHSLSFDKKVDKELIEMKPLMIESKIFDTSPINSESLKKAEDALMKYSKVNEISLREIRQTKKVCVSALGTELALKELKSILRKKHAILRTLFTTGIMPETASK